MKLKEVEKNIWIFSNEYIPRELDDAFDVAQYAWQSGQFLVAEKKFLAIVERCPNHIDALHHLSILYGEAGYDAASYAYSQAAVGVGLRVIPEKFSWKKSRMEWVFVENRPFMRAYHALGLWFLNHKQYSEASESFGRLLAVCPNDNLGVRYMLPECWFAQDMPEKVVAHCQVYQDDAGPDIQYSMALALVALKKVESAKKILEVACAGLPLVGKELLKKSHRKPVSYMPGTITWGGADQAYEYWHHMGKYWSASDEAMHLLKTVGGGG